VHIADRLRAFVHFIAWSNFTSPAVYGLWASQLALLLILVAVVWSVGDLLVASPRRTASEDDPTDALVTRVWVGLAAATPTLFLLGAARLYRPAPITVLALVGVVARAARRRSLRAVADPIVGVWRALRAEPWLWVLFVACSLPALLPPYRWDEGSYQLAQAEQWVRAGSLTVDPFLRYPLNAANWQLVQGAGLMLGGPSLVHLLTWLTGVLAALTVLLFVRRAGAPESLAVIAAIAFFVTPLVQQGLTVGMTDVPLMAALAGAVYFVMRVASDDSAGPREWAMAGLVAGLFVGMKILGLLYIPLFVALAPLRAWRIWASAKSQIPAAILIYCGALFVAGAPWYLRSELLVGDPIPPVVAAWRGTPSPDWSSWDREAQADHLRAGLSWSAGELARLPVTTLQSTDGGPLRAWPLLGYALLFPFSLLLASWVWRRQVGEAWVAAWYGVGVWIATTYHLRYAMFLPLAVACAAMGIAACVDVLLRGERNARPRAWVAGVLGVAFLIGPTPAAARYIKNAWSRPVPTAPADHVTPGPADSAATVALETIRHAVPSPARLYLVQLAQLKYYLEADGYRAIGDDFHDGRWADFWRLLDAGRADSLLLALPADYVVLTRAAPPDRVARWHATLDALARIPALTPISVDSGTAIFQIRRASGPQER